MNSTVSHPHPYYPIEAELVGYLANEWSVLTLLTLFAGGWVAILGGTLGLVTYVRPKMPNADKLAILWFVLSRSIGLYISPKTSVC